MLQAYILDRERKLCRRDTRSRDTAIDALRVYGIFCIVFAHCMDHGLQLWRGLSISSVYVIQLFLFCSGYVSKGKPESLRPFLLKQVRGLVVPYYLWNLFYGCVVSLLRYAGVICYGEALSFTSLLLTPWRSGDQFMMNYPSWFLLSLFLVVGITALTNTLAARLPLSEKTADHLILLGMFAVSLAAIFLLGQEQYHYGTRIGILRPLLLLPYYQLGYVFRRHWSAYFTGRKNHLWIAGLLLVQVVLNLGFGPFMTRMVFGYIQGNPLLWSILCVTAVLVSMLIARQLAPVLKKCPLVVTVSHSTMSIMLHHMFVMFLLQWVMSGAPGFNTELFRQSIWYDYTFGMEGKAVVLVYVLICLAVPVMFHVGWEKLLRRTAARIKTRSEV